MKKFVILPLILLSLSICSISGQAFEYQRVNDPLPIISDLVAEIEWATGWLKTQSGQWISRENRIPVSLPIDRSSLIDYEEYGLGIDNFQLFQIRNIQIGSEHYYILIKKYLSGFYSIPSSKIDWVNTYNANFYVFSKEQREKVVQDGEIPIEPMYIEFEVAYNGSLSYSHPVSMEELHSDISECIREKINKQSPNSDQQYIVFNVLPIQQEKICYFTMIDIVVTDRTTLYGGLRTSSISKGVVFATYAEVFQQFYFEVSFDVFNNFIPLVK